MLYCLQQSIRVLNVQNMSSTVKGSNQCQHARLQTYPGHHILHDGIKYQDIGRANKSLEQ